MNGAGIRRLLASVHPPFPLCLPLFCRVQDDAFIVLRPARVCIGFCLRAEHASTDHRSKEWRCVESRGQADGEVVSGILQLMDLRHLTVLAGVSTASMSTIQD